MGFVAVSHGERAGAELQLHFLKLPAANQLSCTLHSMQSVCGVPRPKLQMSSQAVSPSPLPLSSSPPLLPLDGDVCHRCRISSQKLRIRRRRRWLSSNPQKHPVCFQSILHLFKLGKCFLVAFRKCKTVLEFGLNANGPSPSSLCWYTAMLLLSPLCLHFHSCKSVNGHKCEQGMLIWPGEPSEAQWLDSRLLHQPHRGTLDPSGTHAL